jgi:hypothetical protein
MIIKNRKAQEMSVGTVILLILGIVILVILILGFSTGWNKLLPWLSSNNVDAIKNSCSVACATNSVYDFCTAERTIKDSTGKKLPSTCKDLAGTYGITDCPGLCP